MAYSAPQDVLDRWPRVHTSNLSHDELRVLIADADALIDARLATRYTVPVATDPSATPPLVKKLSAELALLDVFDRAQNTPDWIRTRLERDDQILSDLASGDLVLVGTDGTPVAQSSSVDAAASTTSQYVPVFGGVPSLHEQYDETRLDDEADERTS